MTLGVTSELEAWAIMQDDPKTGLRVTPGEGMHLWNWEKVRC